MAEDQVGWRQAERYLSAAAKQIIEAIRGDKEELRAYCVNILSDIATNPIAKPGEQVKAISVMADLLGLNAPTLIAPVTPDGQESWSPARMDEIRSRLFERLTQLSKS